MMQTPAFEKKSSCSKCGTSFGFLKQRRHHCRNCGRSLCSSCSTQATLPQSTKPQRVCVSCSLLYTHKAEFSGNCITMPISTSQVKQDMRCDCASTITANWKPLNVSSNGNTTLSQLPLLLTQYCHPSTEQNERDTHVARQLAFTFAKCAVAVFGIVCASSVVPQVTLLATDASVGTVMLQLPIRLPVWLVYHVCASTRTALMACFHLLVYCIAMCAVIGTCICLSNAAPRMANDILPSRWAKDFQNPQEMRRVGYGLFVVSSVALAYELL